MFPTWGNARLWSFVADMNGDGNVTVSDVGLWAKWLFYYPGDIVVWVIGPTGVGKFLEMTPITSYGGSISGTVSFFFWLWAVITLWGELTMSPGDRKRRRERELAEHEEQKQRELAEAEANLRAPWYRNEGNEPLFATNQLLIATSFDEARVGCIGADFGHFAQWKTVVGPAGDGSEMEVAQALGKTALSEQERLIAGMLKPAHLLDLVKNFMLFMQTGGQTIKTVCRYQQYRAVNHAIARLKSGKTRQQDGEHDKRGGIIWHTQGSGKSLTMVFLVRKMRTDTQLRRFKVIVVTDRKDLQGQLSITATLTGEVVDVAESTTGLKSLARRKGPGLIFATIQKYRDPDTAGDAPLTVDDLPKVEEPKPSYKADEKFEVLNEDESILVLVDEAHRTQAGDLHANLLAGLPNCVRIGFTGTPIIMGEKKRTHEIFGEFIDRYTIKEAEADGATVPVLYEGRTVQLRSALSHKLRLQLTRVILLKPFAISALSSS
jgi:type I restriction enzyme R subunit